MSTKDESKTVPQHDAKLPVVGSAVFNMDCMEFMKEVPDKFFNLAIVDQPYGIGAGSKKFSNHLLQ